MARRRQAAHADLDRAESGKLFLGSTLACRIDSILLTPVAAANSRAPLLPPLAQAASISTGRQRNGFSASAAASGPAPSRARSSSIRPPSCRAEIPGAQRVLI